MAKDSKLVYGANGKTNVLMFEPEKLHLVTDKTHLLYDERINLPIDEGMVLNIKELGVLEPIIVWKDPEIGLTCVVAGRQRVKHTLEANKLLLKEGKDPLLVPGVVKRGSANQMAKYMVSENEIRRPDTPLGRAKKMSDALDRGRHCGVVWLQRSDRTRNAVTAGCHPGCSRCSGVRNGHRYPGASAWCAPT